MAWWHRRQTDQAITKAGSIRRCANRQASRRISWTDHRTIGGASRPRRFFGVTRRRPLGGGSPRGGRRRASPATRGGASHGLRACLVVSETEFGLCRFEGVLDRPATPLDADERLQRGSRRAPGGEKRQALVAEMAPDQQTACPQAAVAGKVLRLGIEIG